MSAVVGNVFRIVSYLKRISTTSLEIGFLKRSGRVGGSAGGRWARVFSKTFLEVGGRRSDLEFQESEGAN